MAGKWISAAKGIRYREHETRKHGKRPDRYFALQFKLRGKVLNEAVGWASDGTTQADCEKILAQLRENWRTGSGPQTLAELRAANVDAATKARQQKQRDAELTLPGIFEAAYLPAQHDKTPEAIRNEKGLMQHYVAPFFGDKSIKAIGVADINNFLATMKETTSIRTGRSLSAATIRHSLGLISQIWNHCLATEMIDKPNPIGRVKKPSNDNRRVRFLSRDEAKLLLDALKERSPDSHDAAVLALFCGLRAGEVHALTWADVNFNESTLFLRDTKNGESREPHMTTEVSECLKARYNGQDPKELVFPTHNGGMRNEIGSSFERVVRDLGLNDGISDPRQKVVFHTLRHTCASWLVQADAPLYDVAAVLGHKTIAMTQRYAHRAKDAAKKTNVKLEGILDEPAKARVTRFRQQA